MSKIKQVVKHLTFIVKKKSTNFNFYFLYIYTGVKKQNQASDLSETASYQFRNVSPDPEIYLKEVRIPVHSSNRVRKRISHINKEHLNISQRRGRTTRFQQQL